MRNINQVKIPESIIFHKHYNDFRRYFYANPEVYYMLYNMINDAVNAGVKQLSVKQALGALRWNLNVKTARETGGYKINDKYTSLYAAILAENYPGMALHFERRKLRSGSIHFT